LGDRISYESIVEQFQKIVELGSSVGKQIVGGFEFFKSTIENAGKILTSFSAIKKFLSEVLDRIKNFVNTVSGIFATLHISYQITSIQLGLVSIPKK
jgi:hypothetical protein